MSETDMEVDLAKSHSVEEWLAIMEERIALIRELSAQVDAQVESIKAKLVKEQDLEGKLSMVQMQLEDSEKRAAELAAAVRNQAAGTSTTTAPAQAPIPPTTDSTNARGI